MATATTTPHPQPGNLPAGDFPRRFMTATIAAGQTLAAGAVIGEVTASREFKMAAATSEDGSETPSAVLYEAIDTTSGAAPAEIQIAGDLNGSALVLGEGITLDIARHSLRRVSLFIQ